MIRILHIISALWFLGCYCKNPGIQIRLENSGLNYAKSVGLYILAQKINTIQIPDIDADKDFTIYGLKIDSLNIPDDQSSITMVPPSRISFVAKSVSFSITGNYKAVIHIGVITIPYYGGVTVSGVFDQLSIEAVLGSSKLRPTISLKKCLNSLGDFHISFHGGVLDFIAQLLVGSLYTLLGIPVRMGLCRQLNNIIDNTANGFLAKIPIDEVISTPIGDFHINYGLIDKPTVGSSFVTFDLKGKCYAPGHPDVPFVAPSMAPFKNDPKVMFYVAASSYLFDTIGYAFLESGLLKQTLDKTALNKLLPGKGDLLDTTCPGSMCIGSLIPSLAKKYPTTSCMVILNAVSSPKAAINETGAWINLSADINLVTQSPKATVVSFNAKVEAEVQGIQLVSDSSGYLLKGKVEATAAHITLYNTTLSGFTESELKQLWTLGLYAVIDGELDKMLQKGIQIPNIPYCSLHIG